MLFFCKDCRIEFEVDDEECKGYYNWECPKCTHISPKKDLGLGFGIIWKCDTGTTQKSSYVETPKKTETVKCEAGAKCGCDCPKA
jgi:hypothetical protein